MRCTYTACMAKVVQVRDVPDGVHRTLRLRAAAEGLSLSEYLRREISALAERPTRQEFLASAAAGARSRVTTRSIVAALRADRDGR